ncbi:Zinc carboxypeptidase [Trichostrongylus colubriformis]|uniref:Zinc carboxypeptidase n=1 Tax=Trichostrongylus colubriformis TaxID=6319 RepID=A0AAN8GEG9_TRICO
MTEVWQVATSSEHRNIYAIKIGYPSNVKKPILWIDAGIHAREWITHSAALYIIWQFVHDSSYKRLLQEIDIIVVPNTNPDGYEFSREISRMWRKTRSNSTVSRFSQLCSGVDGNRNYPFHFGEEGVSHWPCQETYCGRVALSEPEVMGLVAAILERKQQIRGYIALHSFGQDILYPWGHKVNEFPPDVEELKSMANGISAAIYSVYGTKYLVSNSAAGLYPASGAADDWAKSIGVKYTFTFELSPTTME